MKTLVTGICGYVRSPVAGPRPCAAYLARNDRNRRPHVRLIGILDEISLHAGLNPLRLELSGV